MNPILCLDWTVTKKAQKHESQGTLNVIEIDFTKRMTDMLILTLLNYFQVRRPSMVSSWPNHRWNHLPRSDGHLCSTLPILGTILVELN